jgi:hypothetical protein
MLDTLKCQECGEEFEDADALVEHSRVVHDMNDNEIQLLYKDLDILEFGESGTGSTRASRREESSTDTDPNEFTADSGSHESEGTRRTTGSYDSEATNTGAGDEYLKNESSYGDSGSSRSTEQPVDGGSISDTDSRSDTDDEEQVTVENIDGLLDNEGGQKWFLFGVGGCGSNLLDAIITRAKYLDGEDEELREAWQRAVRGVVAVNTNNRVELANTYFAQEYVGEPDEVGRKYSIGPEEKQGGGGIEWAGDELAQWTFENDDTEFAMRQWGVRANRHRVDSAQAVVFLHSSVKGTGAGSTPRIARELGNATGGDYDFDYVQDDGVTKFDFSILPEGDDLEPTKRHNGLVGLARSIQEMDAVVPLDNENLRNADPELRSNIAVEETDGYQVSSHLPENEVFISLFETLSFATVGKGGGEAGTIQGEGFDPEDAINPAVGMLPADGWNATPPSGRNVELQLEDIGILMAPAFGRYDPRDEDFTERMLKQLVGKVFTTGKLVKFDHTTAWGGTFLFEAPADRKEEVRRVVGDHLRSTLADPSNLDFDPDESIDVPTPDRFVFREDRDDIRLWALLYNPQFGWVNDWYDWAEEKRGNGDRLGRRMADCWPQVESLKAIMGRESRKRYLEE